MKFDLKTDFKTKMLKMLEDKERMGWIVGKASLNHEMKYSYSFRIINSLRPVLGDVYCDNYNIGEEYYIFDDDKYVFVNKEYPNVAHVLAACKTENNIYPKWLSLRMFNYSVFEHQEERVEDYSIYLLVKYKSKEGFEKYLADNFYSDFLKTSDSNMARSLRLTLELCDKGEYPNIRIYPASNNKNDVFKEVCDCKTNLEMWEKLRGRCVRVVKKTPVLTLGMNNCHLITVNVPAFVFVDKDIKKEIIDEKDFEPQYFFDDYRIVIDKKTKKYGIKNRLTNRSVISCVFDEISYQHFNNPRYFDSDIILVHFKKDGLESMCKSDELNTISRLRKK
jgi:hypothetical protein